ncbi:MAG: prolyl-tRNA synthetase associated domain-containing protein [Geminicoccaceae bacterium]
MHSAEQLFAILDEMSIEHSTIEHPPVFTVDEAKVHTAHLPGGHCKSLFLKDKKGGLWLLVCLEARRIDMNALAKAVSCPRLSFGKPDLLFEILGVTPGSVTPFALINDREQRIGLILDQAMLQEELLNYHPLTNEATTTIKAADLMTFLTSTGHEALVIDLDGGGIDRSRKDAF